MTFTMVATDFDDTLVPIGDTLSDRNRAALAAIRAKGITVAIVSGRTPFGLKTQLARNDVPLDGLYLVGHNGAQALQGWDDQPVFARGLDPALAQAAAELSTGFEVVAMVPEGPHIYTDQPDHPLVAYECRENSTTPVAITSAADLGFVPHKVLFGGEHDELLRLAAALRTEFGDRSEVVLSADFLMEFTALGVHKGTALAGLCEALGVPLGQVVVFGDNHNDVAMFGLGGLSVAVANAVPPLLAVADRVAPASADDGVAVLLEELFSL